LPDYKISHLCCLDPVATSFKNLKNGLFVTLLALFWHLLNFIAPAAGVGLVLALVLHWRCARALLPTWWRLMAVGVAVLVVGLITSERDGSMWTYTALVFSQGTLAWWWARLGPNGRARR
jgi:hypothetical protein